MHTSRMLILVLSSFFILNCGSKAKKQSFDINDLEQKERDTIVYIGLYKYPHIKAEKNVDILVAILAKNNTVYDDAVGIGGAYLEEYASFERLKQIATMKRLFELLQHDSVAVRVYAFKAIVHRDSNLLNIAYQQVKGKDELVKSQSGCIGITSELRSCLQDGSFNFPMLIKAVEPH